MRYLLLLLLFPSLSYAACHPGVNYGQYPITAGNPVCAPYSGSTLGGCFAYCGGASENTLCVEFPLASPPTKGPYTTNGNECQYYTGSDSNSSGNSGGNNGGTDGTNQNPNGLVDVGTIIVGDKYVTDFGKGFNVLANNVNQSAAKVQKSVSDLAKQLDNAMDLNNARYMDPFLSNLSRIAQNTSGMSEGGASTVDFEMAGYLKSIYDQTVADSARTEAYRSSYFDLIEGFRHDVSRFPDAGSGNGNGNGTTAADWQNLRNSLNSLDSWERINSHELSQMQMYLSGISSSSNYIASLLQDSIKGPDVDGDGVGDGVPDKPCEGPLCSFTPPSGSGSSSGFSSVFDDKSIADVKSKIEDKNKAITDKMQDIKSVFKQSDIQITGSYDNDYKNIMGADIDLSGKSNWELFFNSGPKVALWLLALLIAFGILMGGRKNA